jgi:hypothetical protein
MVRQAKLRRSSEEKGISHVKKHQRHVVDRAEHRASGGFEASEDEGASRSESELETASRGSNESGQNPLKDETCTT